MEYLKELEFRRLKESLGIRFDEMAPLKQSEKPNPKDRAWWRIRVSIDGDESFIQQNVEKVVYYTHPTFPKTMREITVTDRTSMFALVIRVWGRFKMRALVRLRNSDVVELEELLPPLRH